MYASLQLRHVPYSQLLRWCARAGGAIVFVAWLILVIGEAVRPNVGPPTVPAYYQAAALALVFAGYALGWRNELAGGVLAIIGTVVFFAIPPVTIEYLPDLKAASFAAPGVLYLLAWIYSDRHQKKIPQA